MYVPYQRQMNYTLLHSSTHVDDICGFYNQMASKKPYTLFIPITENRFMISSLCTFRSNLWVGGEIFMGRKKWVPRTGFQKPRFLTLEINIRWAQ